MTWAAKMAVATETGVPWVMCKEGDALTLWLVSCSQHKLKTKVALGIDTLVGILVTDKHMQRFLL